MANAARTRRKAMLGNLLEPVVLQTIRIPVDHSMAKSGHVEFRNENDSPLLNLTARIEDGRIVLQTASRLPVTLESR